MRKKTMLHEFYCIKCGNKGIPIQRKASSQRNKLHKKKLYCIYCKEQINHIECRNIEDVNSFKEKFNNGEYQEEVMSNEN